MVKNICSIILRCFSFFLCVRSFMWVHSLFEIGLLLPQNILIPICPPPKVNGECVLILRCIFVSQTMTTIIVTNENSKTSDSNNTIKIPTINLVCFIIFVSLHSWIQCASLCRMPCSDVDLVILYRLISV